ncbi:MAG: (4Fe-4S)-binding protein [Bacteroidia bacterium]|nr:(4Fe-4S)-binding protein [Bacteroidia bacterium]
MEKDMTKEYSNGEITIVWKPSVCIHSTMCWKKDTGLPEVFNPRLKPWIRPEGASTSKIIEHIKKCPSGALSFYYNDTAPESPSVISNTRIEALANGPLLVYGNITIKDSQGSEIKKSNVTAFCRCGQSGNKPYCDGSHVKHNFKG